ncbi:VOC family protein [Bradyrhizobium sp. SZCCHNRI1029]|uniref:VOC family protein n=1 Tax=Bradyrhizobium sp. SZCCHNRI1029 TaxID=3057278 RepID=UPI002916E54F|nr:VOC family protein [Bradyrhizobium sp. SZCCHNRI1029]
MTSRKSAPNKSGHKSLFRSNRDVAVHVLDIDKAIEFYGNVLGFERISGEGHVAFETGNFRLWINRDAPQSFVPSFSVTDMAEAKRLLTEHGCTPIGPSAPSYFRDPFGFVFDIIEDG